MVGCSSRNLWSAAVVIAGGERLPISHCCKTKEAHRYDGPIRVMINNGQTDAAVPSELKVMLDLYSEETDRNAIRKAYFGLAHGDPSTFAVQFAVLLTAHAQGLKAYQRPDLDIHKAQVDVSRLIAT